MQSVHVAAKSELSDIETQHHELYYAKDDEEVNVISPFIYERHIFTNSPTAYHELASSNTQGDKITYDANTQFHKLIYVVLLWRPPTVRVNAQYRDTVEIAWCHNLLHNYINFIEWKLGKNSDVFYSQTLNTFILDDLRIRSHNILLYDAMIGNREELIEWSTELVTYNDLSLVCPFGFSQTEKYAIPLHILKLKDNNASFHCRFNKDFRQLLRMRKRANKDAEWTDVKVDDEHLRYLDCGTGLSFPIMIGNYSLVEQQQLDMEMTAATEGRYKIPITSYILQDDTEIPRSTTTIKYTHEVHCAPLVRLIRFAFLNEYRAALNDHSCYTIGNAVNNAIDPLISCGLGHGKLERVPKLSAAVWSMVNDYRYSSHKYPANGYYTHSFSYYPDSYLPDQSSTFRNRVTLSLELRPHSPPDDNPIAYTMKSYLIVFEILTYTPTGATTT